MFKDAESAKLLKGTSERVPYLVRNTDRISDGRIGRSDLEEDPPRIR